MPRKKAVGVKKQFTLRLALLVFAVYTIYSMVTLQAELADNKKVLTKKQEQITEKKISNDELKYLLKSGSEKDLIERAARDKLDFVYQNEEVYEDISGK